MSKTDKELGEALISIAKSYSASHIAAVANLRDACEGDFVSPGTISKVFLFQELAAIGRILQTDAYNGRGSVERVLRVARENAKNYLLRWEPSRSGSVYDRAMHEAQAAAQRTFLADTEALV